MTPLVKEYRVLTGVPPRGYSTSVFRDDDPMWDKFGGAAALAAVTADELRRDGHRDAVVQVREVSAIEPAPWQSVADLPAELQEKVRAEMARLDAAEAAERGT